MLASQSMIHLWWLHGEKLTNVKERFVWCKILFPLNLRDGPHIVSLKFCHCYVSLPCCITIPHYFFSMHALAEFCKSCNLIGSGSGQHFSILPSNPGGILTLVAWTCVTTLIFHFFNTKSIYMYTEVSVSNQIFIRQEVCKYNSNKNIFIWNVQFVIGLLYSLSSVVRVNNQKGDFQQGRESERKKISYLPATCIRLSPYSKKLYPLPWKSCPQPAASGLGFSLYGPPSWQITYTSYSQMHKSIIFQT